MLALFGADKETDGKAKSLPHVETCAPDTVRELLKRLVTAARLEDAANAEGGVVLDTEVDGIRYVLLRNEQSNSHQILLSPREQEIARMVASGYPNKVIASVLDISSWTVCTHLRRIFAKLNVTSRAAMVAAILNRPEQHAQRSPKPATSEQSPATPRRRCSTAS